MLRAISLGYLTIPMESVPKLSWRLAIGDSVLTEGEEIAERWTYHDDVNVTCSFRLDLEETRQRLMLADDSSLGAVIVARTSGTPVVLASDVMPIVGGHQELYFSVPASQLSGTLSLEFQIALTGTGSAPSLLAPSKVGHIVFRTDRRLVLEGTAPRLPMLPVKFSDHAIPNSPGSLWWLRLMTRDLYASTSSAVWLWMNVENDSIKAMLENPDSDESSLWLKFLEIDFLRQLLREALNHDELNLSIEYPEHSLGSALSGVVQLLGESVTYVRTKYQDDPGRVEAELQAKVGQ